MRFMMDKPPVTLHGGAVYPYSEVLYQRYKAVSRFDESGEGYDLSMKVGNELWIPRRFAPAGTPLDLREDGQKVAYTVTFTPKNDDQARVVDEAKVLLTLSKSFILQAPTGYGKTIIGSVLIGHTGTKALVITTKEDLIGQWREALQMILGLKPEEIGEWRGDIVPGPECKVVIGLVHSILKGPARYPESMFRGYGLVICDEVHRMAADSFAQAMWWLPARIRVGLSATPYRKDDKEIVFHSHIGDVEVIGEQETLVPNVIMKHMPWKCPRRIVRDPKTKKDVLVRIPHKAGRTMHILKFIEKDVGCNVEIAKFVRLAYEKGRTTIVFSDTMQHLHNLRATILKSGVKEADTGWYVGLDSGVYTGGKAEKQATREKATRARVIFATYKMCSEGTNLPWLDTCVLAAPRGDVNQIVGRIRREYPDKKQPLVFHPVYRDSPVFSSYADTALKWYKSLGAKVTMYR